MTALILSVISIVIASLTWWNTIRIQSFDNYRLNIEIRSHFSKMRHYFNVFLSRANEADVELLNEAYQTAMYLIDKLKANNLTKSESTPKNLENMIYEDNNELSRDIKDGTFDDIIRDVVENIDAYLINQFSIHNFKDSCLPENYKKYRCEISKSLLIKHNVKLIEIC